MFIQADHTCYGAAACRHRTITCQLGEGAVLWWCLPNVSGLAAIATVMSGDCTVPVYVHAECLMMSQPQWEDSLQQQEHDITLPYFSAQLQLFHTVFAFTYLD